MDLHTALLHPSPHSQYLPGHPTVNVGVWLCVGLSANMYFPKYVGFKSGILQRPHNAFIKCCVLPHQTLPLPAISSAVLPCIASHCILLHFVALHFIALHFIAFCCIALQCNDYIALHCIALVTWSTPFLWAIVSHACGASNNALEFARLVGSFLQTRWRLWFVWLWWRDEGKPSKILWGFRPERRTPHPPHGSRTRTKIYSIFLHCFSKLKGQYKHVTWINSFS